MRGENVMAQSTREMGNEMREREKGRREPEYIDPLASDAPEGTEEELDTSQAEDFWEAPPPPPKGKYDLKLFPTEKCFQIRYLDEDNPDPDEIYYTANLELKIVNHSKELDGSTLYHTVSTRVPRGRSISSMAALLTMMGVNVPPKASHREQARLLAKALSAEPILSADIDWQAWSRLQSRNVFNTMTDFPVNAKGGYQHVVSISGRDGSKEQVVARARVVKWYPKAGKQAESSTTKQRRRVILPAEDEDDVPPF
jgi:hypothetical protein